jgi:hypothetical protein
MTAIGGEQQKSSDQKPCDCARCLNFGAKTKVSTNLRPVLLVSAAGVRMRMDPPPTPPPTPPPAPGAES